MCNNCLDTGVVMKAGWSSKCTCEQGKTITDEQLEVNYEVSNNDPHTEGTTRRDENPE